MILFLINSILEYTSVCPQCDNGKVELIAEQKMRTYKGKNLTIEEQFYQCKQCKFEFTTNQIDEVNVQTVKDAYKELLERFIDFMRKRY